MYTLYAFSILTLIRSWESRTINAQCIALKYALSVFQFQERRPDELQSQMPIAAPVPGPGSTFYNAVRMAAEQIVRDGYLKNQLKHSARDEDSWLGWLLTRKYSQVMTEMLNECGESPHTIQYCLEYSYTYWSKPQLCGVQQSFPIMLDQVWDRERPGKLLGNQSLLLCAIRSGTCSPALVKLYVQNRGEISRVLDHHGSTVLHYQIYNKETLKQLIEGGAYACFELRNRDTHTPLQEHIKGGCKAMVNSLIDHGAVIDKETFKMAIESGSLEIIELLALRMNGSLDINEALTDDGRTALHLAVYREDAGNMSAGLQPPEEGEAAVGGDKTGNPAPRSISKSILVCTQKPKNFHDNPIELLLGLGANIQVRDNDGKTPLHHAVALNDIDKNRSQFNIVRVLLARGADIDAKDSESITALCTCLSSFSRESENSCSRIKDTVKLLLSQGANTKAQDNQSRTAVHHAILSCCDMDIIELLLVYGVDINATDNQLQTALHYATGAFIFNFGRYLVKSGQIEEIFTFLINRGADLHAKDNMGRTPLHLASLSKTGVSPSLVPDQESEAQIELGKYITLRLLLDNGADVEAQDNEGTTALHYAMQMTRPWEARLSTTKLLLHYGADIEAKNNKMMTPLQYAVIQDVRRRRLISIDNIKLLLRYGADIHTTDISGRTLLHNIVLNSVHVNLAKFLLDQGLDKAVEDINKQTAVQLWQPLNDPVADWLDVRDANDLKRLLE